MNATRERFAVAGKARDAEGVLPAFLDSSVADAFIANPDFHGSAFTNWNRIING